MSFLTTLELKTSLASRLKVATVGDLEGYYDDVVPKANTSAYLDIVGRLMRRGFTKEQIDAWDRGAEFQESLGLYFCIVNSGLYAGFDPRSLAALDRRKELDSVLFFIAGIPYDPDEKAGTCGSGTPTLGGIFNYPDPTEPSDYTNW